MVIRPDYYDDFRCIASECQHNCCIGWEIDIDGDALNRYNNEQGVIKEALRRNIALDPCPHFILADNERCPFLNNQNLCELILQGGEDMLCQICRDHPRFYNDLYDVCEMGVGLCCEAAAKIILTKKDPTRLIVEGGRLPQNEFFNKRNQIFAILQDRSLPLSLRINKILDYVGVTLKPQDKDWLSIYKTLEQLDEKWGERLNSVDFINQEIPADLEVPYEQLIWYFIYRHLSGAIDDFMFAERVQFAILSCYIINSLSELNTLNEILEIARMYSSEIEYSDQNVYILLDELGEYNKKKVDFN